MKKKIYLKDHLENIKLFHDISHPTEFSEYSSDLNRRFGDRCYPKFYENLIENKKSDVNQFKKLFEKDNKVKGLKKYDESFDIIKFKKALKKLKIKEIEYNKKLKNPYFERLSNSKNFLMTEYIKKRTNLIKPYYPEVPEVGRYSPLYNCINKHIYEVNFSKTGLNKISEFQHNNNNKESKKFFNNIIKNFPKRENSFKKFNCLEMNKNNKLISTTPKKRYVSVNIKEGYISGKALKDILNRKNKRERNIKALHNKTYNTLNKIKNNHCLKFENYTSRKSLIAEKNYNTEYNTEIPNFYTEKHIKGNIEFDKLSSNKNIKSYFEDISKKNKNPPLGFYQPKYNSVLKKTRDIYFSKKILFNSKQRKLKKIIYSYDVPINYQIAPSLNNKSKLNIKEY